MSRYFLDTRRLICPLPVIRTQDRITNLAHGDELEVRATDPGARHDIPAWCRVHGHEVLEDRVEDDEIIIIVRVQKSAAS